MIFSLCSSFLRLVCKGFSFFLGAPSEPASLALPSSPDAPSASPSSSDSPSLAPPASLSSSPSDLPSASPSSSPSSPSSPAPSLLHTIASYLPTILGTGVGIGVGIAIYVYAPPLLAIAARALFPVVYNLLMGSPTSWWEYAFIYVPLREHFVGLAFNNASPIAMLVAPVMGFVVRKIVSGTSRFVGRLITKGVSYIW
jgi:hypothetical protein